MVFFAMPVMRTVALTLLPSTRIEITATLSTLAILTLMLASADKVEGLLRETMELGRASRYNSGALSESEVSMTVCVAALADRDVIIGACDRMITAADIQFEQHQTKVWQFTASIVAMISGDVSFHTEILQDTYRAVMDRVSANPDDWLNVRVVVDFYIHYYKAARLRRAEAAILAPLGLTGDTFIQRQREMHPDLVMQIYSDLNSFPFRVGTLLFAGVDTSGAHLYTATDGDARCHDSAGFVATGAGKWHASSQFMFAQHSRHLPFPETLFLTYLAKKRSEVAPGVGIATDMFLIGPDLGTYRVLEKDHLDRLEVLHKKSVLSQRRTAGRAKKEIETYVYGDTGRKRQANTSEGGTESEVADESNPGAS